MSTSILPGRRATGTLLVAAALLELTETVLSPLGGGSTASEMGRIAAHQGRFTVSVACGMVAVLLLGPGFLGLANACAARVPRLARFAGWVALSSMTAFFGVRGLQTVQLGMVRDRLDPATSTRVVDGVSATPLGLLLVVVFLGGALLGTAALGVAAWLAAFPRVPAVLLGCFQLVDLAAPSHAGTIAAHALLLVVMVWFATHLWEPEARRSAAPEAVLPEGLPA